MGKDYKQAIHRRGNKCIYNKWKDFNFSRYQWDVSHLSYWQKFSLITPSIDEMGK